MSYMPETVSSLVKSKNDVRSYGSSNVPKVKTESFVDILASTKNTQQSSSKEVSKKESEQTSSSEQDQQKVNETNKEQGSKETEQKDQTEKTENTQQNTDEKNNPEELDAATAALLAGAVFIPPVVTKEAVTVPTVENVEPETAEAVLSILPDEVQVKQEGKEVLSETAQMVEKAPEQAAEGKINQTFVTAEMEQKTSSEEMQEAVTVVKKEQVQTAVKEETAGTKEQTMQLEEQPKNVMQAAPVQTAPAEEVDASTVKVNDSSSILQRQVTQQVSDQIVSNIQEKQQQFTMSLHPERLGQVNVKMLFEGGKVMVQVETNSSLAQHLLSAGVTELKTLLENNGLLVDSVLVEQYLGQGQRDAEHSRNQSQQEHNSSSQFLQENEEDTVDEIVSETVLNSSGLNYSI